MSVYIIWAFSQSLLLLFTFTFHIPYQKMMFRECVTNQTLCQAMRQLASLLKQADDLFQDLGGQVGHLADCDWDCGDDFNAPGPIPYLTAGFVLSALSLFIDFSKILMVHRKNIFQIEFSSSVISILFLIHCLASRYSASFIASYENNIYWLSCLSML